MSFLTKKEIIELDQRIDAAIASEELLSIPRDIALINLLRFFEDYVRLYAVSTPQSSSPETYTSLLKSGQDGMTFAVRWIFQYCPPISREAHLDYQMDVYLKAGRLHEAGMRYSLVWDIMSMLQRGRYVAELDQNGKIHVRYSNPEAEDLEVASYFVAPPDSPDSRESTIALADELHPSTFLAKIKIRKHHSGTIRYVVPDEVFEDIAEHERQLLSSRWELDGTWDVGGYTLYQFREFWTALITFCWIHHWVCIASGVKGGALNNVIKMRQKSRWEKDLANRSGLDKSIVSLILDDLTYDPNLYGSGKKQPDVTYQPFFPIRKQLLGLSNQLVMLSNAERNLWDLSLLKDPMFIQYCVIRRRSYG
jgi:hypothetical protein